MTRSALAHAFDHHVWATGRLLEVLGSLSDEQLATTVPGTYGSILDTARHLVGADRSYLAVLSGGRVDRIDEDSMDLAEITAAMAGAGGSWSAILEADGDPDEVVVRQR